MRGKWPGLQAHVVQPESMDRQASCRPSPGERSPQAEDTVPLLQTRSQAVSLWTPFSTLWPFIQLRSQRIPMLVQTMVLGLVAEKESQTPSHGGWPSGPGGAYIVVRLTSMPYPRAFMHLISYTCISALFLIFPPCS